MQPRVLHVLRALGLCAGTVPARNLVFVQSRQEQQIAQECFKLADACWPFHDLILMALRRRVIPCFGTRADDYVRGWIGARRQDTVFTEVIVRPCESRMFSNAAGLRIVVATHPSIADWSASATDPDVLVRRALAGGRHEATAPGSAREQHCDVAVAAPRVGIGEGGKHQNGALSFAAASESPASDSRRRPSSPKMPSSAEQGSGASSFSEGIFGGSSHTQPPFMPFFFFATPS